MAEALGLAAAVAQFASMGLKVVRFSVDIYGSSDGMTEEGGELMKITEDMKNVTEKLKHETTGDFDSSTNEDIAIRQLAIESNGLAQEIMGVLEGIQGKITAWGGSAERSKRKTIKAAFKLAWKEKDIRQMEQRLKKILDEISFRKIVHMSLEQGHASASLKRIEKQLADISVALKSVPDNASTKDVVKGIFVVLDEANFEVSVLRKLRDCDLVERYRQIKTAFGETGKWALDTSETPLREWLRSGDGMFWISGKPGSGKSTLMKQIYQDQRCPQLLREWAGQRKLVFVSHFFWIAGSEIQRSLFGLYSSLLTQVFEEYPETIRRIIPKPAIETLQKLDLRCLEDWFQRLVKFAEVNEDYKFCFLIDALDEFQPGEGGDLVDVVDLARSLSTTKSTNLKLLTSSRPWPQFRNGFNGYPHILMEHFTLADMELYAWRQLESNLPPPVCPDSDSGWKEKWRKLAKDIAKKATGVWLWTFLVVREVKKIAASSEGFKKAKQSIEGFPADLEDYFRHTLARIEPQYRKDGARLLLIATEATKRERKLSLYGLILFLQDPDAVFSNILEPLDSVIDGELRSVRAIQDRLANRTMGLLELSRSKGDEDDLRSLEQIDISDARAQALARTDIYLSFLHRTVFDFLRDYYREELLQTSGQDCDVQLYLLCTCTQLGPGLDRLQSWVKKFPSHGDMKGQTDNDSDLSLNRSWKITRGMELVESLICDFLESQYIDFGTKYSGDSENLGQIPTLLAPIRSLLGFGPCGNTGSHVWNPAIRPILKHYLRLFQAIAPTERRHQLKKSMEYPLFSCGSEARKVPQDCSTKTTQYALHWHTPGRGRMSWFCEWTEIMRLGRKDRRYISEVVTAMKRNLPLALALIVVARRDSESPHATNSRALLTWYIFATADSIQYQTDDSVSQFSNNRRALSMLFLFLEISGVSLNEPLGFQFKEPPPTLKTLLKDSRVPFLSAESSLWIRFVAFAKEFDRTAKFPGNPGDDEIYGIEKQLKTFLRFGADPTSGNPVSEGSMAATYASGRRQVMKEADTTRRFGFLEEVFGYEKAKKLVDEAREMGHFQVSYAQRAPPSWLPDANDISEVGDSDTDSEIDDSAGDNHESSGLAAPLEAPTRPDPEPEKVPSPKVKESVAELEHSPPNVDLPSEKGSETVHDGPGAGLDSASDPKKGSRKWVKRFGGRMKKLATRFKR